MESLIKENFDTFLIIIILLFLIKEGVEDITIIISLVALLFS